MNRRRRGAAVLARVAALAGAAGLVLGGCSGGGGSGGPTQPVTVVLSCGASAGQQGPGLPPARVACGPRYTLFTGGILVRRPACVRIAVSGPGVAAVTVAVPVLVSGRCTAGGRPRAGKPGALAR